MSDAYLFINGQRADKARLSVPPTGRWLLEIEYVGAPIPEATSALVEIGDLELHGTVHRSESFVGSTKARIVGGQGGWGKDVPGRAHHNDGNVRRADVISQLATEVGEIINTAGDSSKMRIDHVRVAGPAWRALEHALGGLPWRVDFDGVTRYGARPVSTLGAGVELLEADPTRGYLTFAAPDPGAVPIGATVSDSRLSSPLVIREVEAEITGTSTRVQAWATAKESGIARLLKSLQILVSRVSLREPYLGPRKYRVVGMRASAASVTLTRIALQIVNKSQGLPDLLLVEAWPGLAGSRAELTPGSLVLVQFVDGDAEQPYVCAFSTADDPAWKPVHVVIDASSTMKLGLSASEVQLAGTRSVATPGDELGAFVRYGDAIMMPAGSAATPTAVVIIGSAFPATTIPATPFTVSRAENG